MSDATAGTASGLPVTIVNACLRGGRGGSPTAVLAFLAERRGDAECQVTAHTSGRVFTGWATRVNGRFDAAFDPGSVDVREVAADAHDPVLHALGVTPDTLAPGICVATLGRPRLLVPLSTRSVLAGLAPDVDRLRDACDRLGLLGCYVYSVPTAEGRVAGRRPRQLRHHHRCRLAARGRSTGPRRWRRDHPPGRPRSAVVGRTKAG